MLECRASSRVNLFVSFTLQEIASFLLENRFAKQAEIFHTHFPEGRVGENVVIYVRNTSHYFTV